jgi:hypothetical protein
MQLTKQNVQVTMSEGFTPKESYFGIGDEAVILGILRDRLYANKIKTICQEVMSNGRDAHREAGRTNLPIEVTIPNAFDPFFKVKDYGIGISPERMDNIFVKFGSSTKREDNVQTGGFGLGAKSPFAYTDTFSVETITPDENGALIQRVYTAILDESGRGKMILVSESASNAEYSGTTIIVPAKPSDFNEFYTWSVKSSWLWEVKPVIKGVASHVWDSVKVLSTGTRWKLVEVGEKKSHYYNSDRDNLITVDEIPYSLNFNNLNNLSKIVGDNTKYNKISNLFNMTGSSNKKIWLDFAVGEIPLTVSREQIEYTEGAINIIAQRLLVVADEFSKTIQATVEQMPTLREAISFWQDLEYYSREIVGKLTWHGKKVQDSYEIPMQSSVRIHNYVKKNVNIKLQSEQQRTLDFGTNSLFFYNDTGENERRRVLTVFEQNPTAREVKVLCFPDNIAYANIAQVNADNKKNKLNAIAKAENKQEDLKILEDIYYSELQIPNIETYEKRAIIRNVSSSTGNTRVMPIAYIYSSNVRNFDNAVYDEEDIDLENGEGVYAIVKNRKGINVDYRILDILAEDNVIIGIAARNVKKLGDGWKTVEAAAEEVYKKLIDKISLTDVNCFDVDNMQLMQHTCSYAFEAIKLFSTDIQDKDNIAYTYYVTSSKTYDISALKIKIDTLKTVVKDNTKFDKMKINNTVIKKLQSQFRKKYPILFMIGYAYDKDAKKHILDYINLVDAQDRKNETPAEEESSEKEDFVAV